MSRYSQAPTQSLRKGLLHYKPDSRLPTYPHIEQVTGPVGDR